MIDEVLQILFITSIIVRRWITRRGSENANKRVYVHRETCWEMGVGDSVNENKGKTDRKDMRQVPSTPGHQDNRGSTFTKFEALRSAPVLSLALVVSDVVETYTQPRFS